MRIKIRSFLVTKMSKVQLDFMVARKMTYVMLNSSVEHTVIL